MGAAEHFCESTAGIWRILGIVINVFKIAIPIIIVLLAMLDLGKAVMAGEEKEIKAAQKLLIKRIVYGVIIFFVVTIVQLVFRLVNWDVKDGSVDDRAICWICATNPGICKVNPDTNAAINTADWVK